MQVDIYLYAPAVNPNDIILSFGLRVPPVIAVLPRDDKPKRVRHPAFRRPPEQPAIVAWSLFQSLVDQHGVREALRIYSAMEAERRGPFQPGAKYDPDKGTTVFVAPLPVAPGRRLAGTLLPTIAPVTRRPGLRVILPPRLED